MATKKFVIEVEEGATNCSKCPFANCCSKCTIDCNYVDLATMKIKEMED